MRTNSSSHIRLTRNFTYLLGAWAWLLWSGAHGSPLPITYCIGCSCYDYEYADSHQPGEVATCSASAACNPEGTTPLGKPSDTARV